MINCQCNETDLPELKRVADTYQATEEKLHYRAAMRAGAVLFSSKVNLKDVALTAEKPTNIRPLISS